MPIDRSFAAVSDPTRRAVLDRLGRADASITELAGQFGMTLTGMKKHVRILEVAGLVETEKIGRTRRCRLGRDNTLADIGAWVATYRRMVEERLDHLEAFLEQRKDVS